jgi:xylan 1,4-beta-xylosidase
MSLTERPGFLRLKGRESIGSEFDQALVARRQQAFRFRAETKLEYNPQNFQQFAGLVCYYNSYKYHYLYVSLDDEGRRFVDVMQVEGELARTPKFPLREGALEPADFGEKYLLADKGPVWLRCAVDGHRLKFYWSENGEDWNDIPLTLDHSQISDEAGKGEGASFTGAFVGMACQDLSGAGACADFDYFEYVELI